MGRCLDYGMPIPDSNGIAAAIHDFHFLRPHGKRDGRAWYKIEHTMKHDHCFSIFYMQRGAARILPVFEASVSNLFFHRKLSRELKQYLFRTCRERTFPAHPAESS
jgi:hypothetical protein